MRGIRLKKYLAVLLSFAFIVTNLFQGALTVQGEAEKKVWTVKIGESLDIIRKATVKIPNIFKVYDTYKEDGTKVPFTQDGESVTVSVYGGDTEIKDAKKIIAMNIYSDTNVFQEKQEYSDEFGYEGTLYKTDKIINDGNNSDSTGLYKQAYMGEVIKKNCTFYKPIEVKIEYAENVAPEIKVTLPLSGQRFSNELNVEGVIKDENVDDEISVYCSVYDSKGKAYDIPLGSKIADGSEQSFEGKVDVKQYKLKDGKQALYFWAEDKKGAKSPAVVIPVDLDTTGPNVPVISQNPDKDTLTNGDVEVTITFPEDADKKIYYTSLDSTQKEYTEPFNISVNQAVYAYGKDDLGNVGITAEWSVENIDKDPPAAPTFKLNTEADTGKSVVVEVYYSEDTVKKEYKVFDGDWKEFSPGGSNIIPPDEIGTENGTIQARATDKAGNSVISDVMIDTKGPSKPEIVASATKTVGDPIKVKIIPGKDDMSGTEITEYYLSDAEESAWKAYEGEFSITKEGKTTIYARSIDKEGNKSEITEETVEIGRPEPSPSTNTPGGGTPGGGTPGGSTPGGSTPSPSSITTPKVTTEPTPNNPKGNGGSSNPVDLSVFLTADKTIYGENDTITFVINYKNKSQYTAENVVVKADIPQNTSIADSAGGTVNGSQVEWNVGNLTAGAMVEIKYKVKVNLLNKSEVSATNKAVVKSSSNIVNTDDDESVYPFLLYSNRYESNSHKKYILGYEDNTFRPENKITRAEVATILVRVLNLEVSREDVKIYNDFDNKHWAYNYINTASKHGLFTGYKDGSFNPNGYITRAELSTVLARYNGLKSVEPMKLHFTDINGHWAKNYIEEIYRIKLIEGYKDGTFLPNASIKRSETVTIINRMLHRGPLTGAELEFTDVNKTHWAYGQILESCTDHYYTRNADGSETKVVK